MTKKRIATMATCIALVGAVAVGGTLALLSAQSNDVTNTFTVGKGYDQNDPNPDFYLDEAKVAQITAGENIGGYAETADLRVEENTYANIVENALLAKDPQFHISDDCEVAQSWIVAKISGFNATPGATTLKFTDVDDTDMANGAVAGSWYKVTEGEAEGTYEYTLVDGVEDMGNGVYIYSASLAAGQSTKDLFQQLQVDTFVPGQNPSTITVTGYAVEGVAGVSFENMRDDVMVQIDASVF